ncbi:hypothetical protein CS542_01635 [Pedobacter sp. IW39]|nr:hypothetical protein CS542_01635 [Pedobacter sp. IW39]
MYPFVSICSRYFYRSPIPARMTIKYGCNYTVMGYMLSKFYGIRFISEIKGNNRVEHPDSDWNFAALLLGLHSSLLPGISPSYLSMVSTGNDLGPGVRYQAENLPSLWRL